MELFYDIPVGGWGYSSGVEHLTADQEVPGSNPGAPCALLLSFFFFFLIPVEALPPTYTEALLLMHLASWNLNFQQVVKSSVPPVTFLVCCVFASSATLISWRGRGSLPEAFFVFPLCLIITILILFVYTKLASKNRI